MASNYNGNTSHSRHGKQDDVRVEIESVSDADAIMPKVLRETEPHAPRGRAVQAPAQRELKGILESPQKVTLLLNAAGMNLKAALLQRLSECNKLAFAAPGRKTVSHQESRYRARAFLRS